MIIYGVTFIFYFKNHGHPTYCQGHGADFLLSVCTPLRPLQDTGGTLQQIKYLCY